MSRQWIEIIQDDDIGLEAKKVEIEATFSAKRQIPDAEKAEALKHLAVHGCNDLLKFVLAQGAGVDVTEGDGWTALLAIAGDATVSHAWNEETVSILLQENPNLKLYSGVSSRTVLHWAAFNGHEDLARQVIENHARKGISEGYSAPFIDRWSSQAQKPLHLAAQNGHTKLLQLLLEHGASIDSKSSLSTTPLHLAARNGKCEVIDILLGTTPAADVNARQVDGSTPLHLAVEGGHINAVKRLLAHPDIMRNPYDRQFWTPLLKAVSQKNQPMVDLLAASVFDLKSLAQREARNMFRAFLVEFHDNDEQRNTMEVSTSISSLLANSKSTTGDHYWTHGFTPAGSGAPKYRWAHLPINNFEWTEETATKALLDSDSTNFDEFRSVLSTLSHQERSTMRHSKHMRPGCQIKLGLYGDIGTGVDWGVYGALYMPYLSLLATDWHSDMVEAITNSIHNSGEPFLPKDRLSQRLAALLKAYDIRSPNLHLPRTLDQYRHPAMHTTKKDRDQVVYRYQKTHSHLYPRPRIYMVSQLWVWMLPKVIITSFADLNDEESAFDHILQDIRIGERSTEKPTDLLVAVIDRFIGFFDRHFPLKSRERLFAIFESSVAELNLATDDLLGEFQRDVLQISEWIGSGNRGKQRNQSTPLFVNRLIDISKETEYYFECVDMTEELTSLSMVLEEQDKVLQQLRGELDRAHQSMDSVKAIVNQLKTIRRDVAEIERLKKQVENVKSILTQLLDLKPRHATAIEARFARDQAEDTARSGQIIMVFTVVTILFLPLSFMAAFFAINIDSFPQNEDGRLPLGWVSKYLFSISMAISIPIIVSAWFFADMQKWTGGFSLRRKVTTNSKTPDGEDTRADDRKDKHVVPGGPVTDGKRVRDNFSRKAVSFGDSTANGTNKMEV